MARNKGFSIVEVLLIVLVLALAGFLSWKVWDVMNTPKSSDQTTQQQSTDDEVKSAEDLDKVDKTLDDTNLEGDEATQLDAETSF